jgi:hypothetical protein
MTVQMGQANITKAVLWLAAGLVIGYLVWWVAPHFFTLGADPRSKEFLGKVAAEINQSVPVMIDKETELLPAEVAEGMLVYNYRLISFSVVQLDRKKFAAAARQQVTQGACGRPETRDGFLKKGVTLRYSYYDKDKQPIATVDVTPSDCGF